MSNVIPDEGMRLICKTGEIDGKPIWKDVGKINVNARGNIVVYLDRSFNPAGVLQDCSEPTATLYAKEITVETPRPSKPRHPLNYLEDDIPF